jgi:hypothetical protein
MTRNAPHFGRPDLATRESVVLGGRDADVDVLDAGATR